MLTPAEMTVLAERILAGDARAIARAATLAANQPPAFQELRKILPAQAGRAMIVGITGPPGVGKSTLVDQLIQILRTEEKTVGVIAVDPSSPFSKGAILGDRVRMQRHHQDPGVLIRSMATRGTPGGLAEGVRETAFLFSTAGRDVVFIETVGVGQSEVEIARVADVTVLVLAPGLGDDVQAMKAGIMEIADVFAINKSDRPGAERLEQEIRMMQSLGANEERSGAAPVCRVVASEGAGVEDLLAAIRFAFRNRT
jgi:LAO/AO transport system kinase